MGIYFRRRIRLGKNSWLNISKSGVSGSQRVGPFTFNSRGRSSIRMGRGLAYRGGCATILVIAFGATAVLSIVIARTV